MMEGREEDDILEVCRLCLEKGDLISIFDERFNPTDTIRDAIKLVTKLEVSQRDNISTKICPECLQFLTTVTVKIATISENSDELKKRRLMLGASCSVKEILLKYPGIILPPSILKAAMLPTIRLDNSLVVDWQKRRKAELANSLKHKAEFKISPKRKSEVLESPKRIKLAKSAPGVPEEVSPQILVRVDYSRNSTDNSAASSPSENKSKNSNNNHPDLTSAVVKSNNEYQDLFTLNQTKSIYVCSICNGICNTGNELTRHKKKHMRCNMCKLTFRSMQDTEEHMNNHCLSRLKSNMKKKVESFFKSDDEEPLITLSSEEPEAAVGAPTETITIDDVNDECLDKRQNEADVEDVIPSTFIQNKGTTQETPVEVISLLSDDENEENTEKSPGDDLKPLIKLVGDDILDLKLDDDEATLLREILKTETKDSCTMAPSNSDIVDVSNLAQKDGHSNWFQLKNFNHHVDSIVQIFISYSDKISVEYVQKTEKDKCWKPANKNPLEVPCKNSSDVINSQKTDVSNSTQSTVQSNLRNLLESKKVDVHDNCKKNSNQTATKSCGETSNEQAHVQNECVTDSQRVHTLHSYSLISKGQSEPLAHNQVHKESSAAVNVPYARSYSQIKMKPTNHVPFNTTSSNVVKSSATNVVGEKILPNIVARVEPIVQKSTNNTKSSVENTRPTKASTVNEKSKPVEKSQNARPTHAAPTTVKSGFQDKFESSMPVLRVVKNQKKPMNAIIYPKQPPRDNPEQLKTQNNSSTRAPVTNNGVTHGACVQEKSNPISSKSITTSRVADPGKNIPNAQPNRPPVSANFNPYSLNINSSNRVADNPRYVVLSNGTLLNTSSIKYVPPPLLGAPVSGNSAVIPPYTVPNTCPNQPMHSAQFMPPMTVANASLANVPLPLHYQPRNMNQAQLNQLCSLKLVPAPMDNFQRAATSAVVCQSQNVLNYSMPKPNPVVQTAYNNSANYSNQSLHSIRVKNFKDLC